MTQEAQQKKGNRGQTKGLIFSATVNGHKGSFNTNNLTGWKRYHGTDDKGNTVESPEGMWIGDKFVIRAGGKALALSASDAQVLAAGIMSDIGCQYTSPNGKLACNATSA